MTHNKSDLFNELQVLYERCGAMQNIASVCEDGYLLFDFDAQDHDIIPAVVKHYFSRLAPEAEILRKLPIIIRENDVNRPIREVVFTHHRARKLLKRLAKSDASDTHRVFIFSRLAQDEGHALLSRPLTHQKTKQTAHLYLINPPKKHRVGEGLLLMAPLNRLVIRHGTTRDTIPISPEEQQKFMSFGLKKNFTKNRKQRSHPALVQNEGPHAQQLALALS